MADSSRMQQILWNLLTNAVKFSETGGKVEISLREVNNFAELSIADNGQGISRDFLPFVFDRFRQAEGGSVEGLLVRRSDHFGRVVRHGLATVAQVTRTGERRSCDRHLRVIAPA